MESYDYYLETIGEYGRVVELNYPLVRVEGLPHIKPHEVVMFETGQQGEVFSIHFDTAEILLYSKNPPVLNTGVVRTNTFLQIPVGAELLGTIINPFGKPLSAAQPFLRPKETRPVDQEPSGIGKRARITRPFLTGVSIIDFLIPLGKGQRELILGDRKTGKSSFMLQLLKDQIKNGAIGIYAGIARKKSHIHKVFEFFKKDSLQDRLIIVGSSPFDSPGEIFVTPYAAITIAEYFSDLGQDVVVIFDDMTAHSKFYREIGLAAKRFPGRESYPGDIFHLHARLLERAGNFKHSEKKEVSITCFPVVETIEADMTGYIVTNLMGMTDGHIFFDSNIYYNGRRPAVNTSLSVTRVGRQTQSSLKREINRELTSFLNTYSKMLSFAHFGPELSEKVKNVLKRGEQLYSFFEQHYNTNLPEEIQLIIFGLIWGGLLQKETGDDIVNMRERILKAYDDPQKRTNLNNMVKVETLYDLTANLTRNKGELFKICEIVSAVTI